MLMSNSLQLNASISSINTDSIYWCLGAVINHVSSQLSQLLKESLFLQILLESNYSHMSNPSQLCGMAQVRYSTPVFAYSGLQTEECQASEEMQTHTATRKGEERHTDRSTL